MDPVTAAALIGGGVSLFGGYKANQQTKASTARQMAFQERMSNTAHQRQVADLRKAGINPILSAKLGGASTPAGASYTAQNIGAAAVQGYQNVSSARQAQAQTRQIDAQVELTKAQADKVRLEFTKQMPEMIRKMRQEGLLAQARVNATEAETALTIIRKQLIEGDAQTLEEMGLSQMQMKHTPLNQIGSLAIDGVMDMIRRFPEALKETLDDATNANLRRNKNMQTKWKVQ